MKIQPVIMSGGSGTRLWPMSRAAKPKQFLSLVTDRTMFQETALRVSPESEGAFAAPVVIAGARHGAIVARQLADIGIAPGEIILEPAPRNTAAVAAVASAWVEQSGVDALILLMPADHHIADAEGFRAAVAGAADAAAQGYIATFGIQPNRPHTGYGYIEAGDAVSDGVFCVKAFKEKPDKKTAQAYLDQGGFYWNAGIFLFRASAMLEELESHAPEIRAAAASALERSAMSGAARRLDEQAFSECPSNSIDYAVMEKTDKAAVAAPVDVGWTDIGSWTEVPAKEDDRVIQLGDGDNIVRTDGPVIAAAGVDGLVIVATGDAVLVARRDDAQGVRGIVEELKKRDRNDLL
ncbi:MAG: mannose-1-phosphate guanylyltransferase/mannose-6-phosphate isomerase [Pseudomonadota bacterium]